MLDCKQVPCHLRKNLPATSHLRWSVFYSAVLVTRETCRIHGAAIYSHAVLVTRDGTKRFFLRSLNVSLPRATLVAWWKQSLCKQHLFLDYFATLVMTKARWPRRLKRPLAMTIYTTFAMTTFFKYILERFRQMFSRLLLECLVKSHAQDS